LPNVLDPSQNPRGLFSQEDISGLQGLIAESEKGARRFLRACALDLPILLLNEHTQDYDAILEPLRQGQKWGLISDCGLPCLADPGSVLVQRAQAAGVVIHAICGPSSLTLILMLSGLPAQNFSFHGYLQREKPLLSKQLLDFQKRGGTHIFIETPYRNIKLFETLLETLNHNTLVCLACDLTLPTQIVRTQPICVWKKQNIPEIHKKPAIFAIFAST